MKLAGSTALVTGANRGLGRHLTEQLITLDITDPASVDAAAKATGNVTCRRAPAHQR